jgi:riboflavin biosynthesis pyrimidine reductase
MAAKVAITLDGKIACRTGESAKKGRQSTKTDAPAVTSRRET